MKISKSKQELARIISENGGWVKGNYAVQDKDDKCIWFMLKLEGMPQGRAAWPGSKSNRISCDKVLPNWHQTILSREEYLHLYPATDADGWIEWNDGNIPVGFGTLVDVKLRGGNVELGQRFTFSDSWGHHGGPLDIIAYRPHKPEAAPAPQEPKPVPAPEAKPTIEHLAADYRNAKAYAEAKLEELVAAGAALGLDISIAKAGS